MIAIDSVFCLERDLLIAIGIAEQEDANARRDGAQGLDWARRYNTQGGFSDQGYAGWDHKALVMGMAPIRPSDELRLQIDRCASAQANLATLRLRLCNEVTIPRQSLATRYPVLYSLSLETHSEV
jgi:hypothetical protein